MRPYKTLTSVADVLWGKFRAINTPAACVPAHRSEEVGRQHRRPALGRCEEVRRTCLSPSPEGHCPKEYRVENAILRAQIHNYAQSAGLVSFNLAELMFGASHQ